MRNKLPDLSLYGIYLKIERTARGFRKADNFIAAIEKKTGLGISRDIYYRLESGKAEPTLMRFLAINLTLYGTMEPQGRMANLFSEKGDDAQ